jgi:hypothetical protein
LPGYAALPTRFRDVADQKALRRITPSDILGLANDVTPTALVTGYGAIYPSLQSFWITNRDLVFNIMDVHDVSKHRQTIYTGGKLRLDPPPGFFEACGVRTG